MQLISSATVSPDGQYRYDLARYWRGPDRVAMWCMLNPSTADATEDDPTIRRVIRFTKDHLPAVDGIVVVNLFALRATRPVHLLDDPRASVGHGNEAHIRRLLETLPITDVVAAWGNWPQSSQAAMELAFQPRKRFLMAARESGHIPKCLGTTKQGDPRHPLYLKAETVPEVYDFR